MVGSFCELITLFTPARRFVMASYRTLLWAMQPRTNRRVARNHPRTTPTAAGSAAAVAVHQRSGISKPVWFFSLSDAKYFTQSSSSCQTKKSVSVILVDNKSCVFGMFSYPSTLCRYPSTRQLKKGGKTCNSLALAVLLLCWSQAAVQPAGHFD